VRSEREIEELMCKDATKIIIDEDFKNSLKNTIIHGNKYNDITKLSKRKNNIMQNKYLKIASGFVICVVVGGSVFKAVEAPSIRNIFTKAEGVAKVIAPIESVDNSAEDINKKIAVESKDDTEKGILNSSKGTSQLALVEREEKSKDKAAVVKPKIETPVANNDPGKTNSGKTVDDTNDNVVTVDKGASVSIDVKSPLDVPNMENVKENASKILESYDPRYSSDGLMLASVKNSGIYIKDMESLDEKKLIAYNDKTEIVNKPNITPSNEIIYYKAEKTNSENGAIYKSDKTGKQPIKIVDGKNPMVSKDGEKVVYESDGKICILQLKTNVKTMVDTGKYPSWSDNGKLISYVKEEKETQSYDENTEKKEVFIEKSYSSLWVFDLTTENTIMLTNKEVNIDNKGIQSWAGAVKNGSITSNLDLTSKYSYFESAWSVDNKEICVIRRNNVDKGFQLIKYKLDK
jgi:hypothetical protein